MALEMMTYNIRLTMFLLLVLLWGYRNSWSAWADRVFNLGIHLVSYPTSNTDKAESDLQTTIYSPFVASCILEEVSQSLSLPLSYSLPVSMGFRGTPTVYAMLIGTILNWQVTMLSTDCLVDEGEWPQPTCTLNSHKARTSSTDYTLNISSIKFVCKFQQTMCYTYEREL